MKRKSIFKVVVTIAVALAFVMPVAAVDNNKETILCINREGTPYNTLIFDDDWIHFDNGHCTGASGIVYACTFEWAARFTPDELREWINYQISVVRHHHGYPGGSAFYMKGNIKIYEEGTSTKPGDLITSEPFEVTEIGWFDVELSEPVLITGDEDIWVSIEGTHSAGQFPAGMDSGPSVPGKSRWLYTEAERWHESPFNFNFCIWAGLEQGSDPPDPPKRPDGPTEGVNGVEYTFYTSTTDPEGEQVFYLWDWDDGTASKWIGPYDSGAKAQANHSWAEEGDYNITVRAKDVNGARSDWSDPHIIAIVAGPKLEIDTIKGGLFKVSVVIKNIGGTETNGVNWSIKLDGGAFIGKETEGTDLDISAGGNETVTSKIILGFGHTKVTVTAGILGGSSDTREQNGFVFLFFIKVNPGG